jgi:hypothetical protein
MDAYINYLIDKFNTDGMGIAIAGEVLRPEITGLNSIFGSAKTRYENDLPVCRAKDSVTLKKCSACRRRKACTPQIRLDIAHWSGVVRFLLSGAALRNFMLFLSALNQRSIILAGTAITLAVLNSGRWGELRFTIAPINL